MINYYTDTREDTIDSEELLLYNLIMDYRLANGLDTIPLSLGLTITASRHALDTIYNEGEYSGHSWSDAPYDSSNPSTYSNMWDAPQRLGTTYQGDGYEITTGYLGTSLLDYDMSAAQALVNWQSSTGHNNVILNLDIWAGLDWESIGIAIHQGIAHVWFGSEVDAGGSPVIEGQTQYTFDWHYGWNVGWHVDYSYGWHIGWYSGWAYGWHTGWAYGWNVSVHYGWNRDAVSGWFYGWGWGWNVSWHWGWAYGWNIGWLYGWTYSWYANGWNYGWGIGWYYGWGAV